MLKPTRRLIRYLAGGNHPESWVFRPGVITIKLKGNSKDFYRITVDATGGFEIRRLSGGDDETVADKSPDSVPKGLALAQYRKDVELVKQLYAFASKIAVERYEQDINSIVSWWEKTHD